MAGVNMREIKYGIYELINNNRNACYVKINDEDFAFDKNRYFICMEWQEGGYVSDYDESTIEEMKDDEVIMFEDDRVYRIAMYIGTTPKNCWYCMGVNMLDFQDEYGNPPCIDLYEVDYASKAVSHLLEMYEAYSKPIKEAHEEEELRTWYANEKIALTDWTTFNSAITDLVLDEEYSECYETVAGWAMEDAMYYAVKEHGPFENIKALHECLVHEYI